MEDMPFTEERIRIGGENGGHQLAAYTSILFQGLLCVSAAVPYLLYFFLTFRYKSLMQPKNVFKSNFAFRYGLKLFMYYVCMCIIRNALYEYYATP